VGLEGRKSLHFLSIVWDGSSKENQGKIVGWVTERGGGGLKRQGKISFRSWERRRRRRKCHEFI